MNPHKVGTMIKKKGGGGWPYCLSELLGRMTGWPPSPGDATVIFFYSILIIFCKGGNLTVKIDDPLMVKAVAGCLGEEELIRDEER